MENKDKHNEARIDNEILFSKTVKAGKRVYYIDVKRDRKGEFYISMTESKRVKDSENSLHPTFEKHKIFLYREDLEKFQSAFNAAAAYTQEQEPRLDFATEWSQPEAEAETETEAGEYKIDIEFWTILLISPLAEKRIFHAKSRKNLQEATQKPCRFEKKCVILHPICPAEAKALRVMAN